MSTAAFARSTHLRMLNPRQDLSQVADLVELCFAENMDADGHTYIRQMRRVAQEARYLRISSVRLEGFVWVEGGKIIGNLSLIPFTYAGKPIYLIANVATHPDHRRRGIAYQLTQEALNYARKQGMQSCWLQVRDDNQAAYQLYLALDFLERSRRSTWMFEPSSPFPRTSAPAGITVTRRLARDWPRQLSWLLNTYPSDVRWNLPIEINQLKPHPMDWILRILSNAKMAHWVARRQGEVIGSLSWESSRLHADWLWAAANPDFEEPALRALLLHAHKVLDPRRAVSVNYPAGQAEAAFRSAGYHLHNTLIWMEARL